MSRTRPTLRLRALVATGFVACWMIPALSSAQEASGQAVEAPAAKVTAKVVFQAIDNPTGLAVQPETDHVFVAARPAVYRFVPPAGDAEYGTAHVVVFGYPTDVYGKGPMYNIGPLGLAFLSKNLLVVGDGSRPDGEELARVFEIGTAPEQSGQGQVEGRAKYTLGPIPKQEGVTASGEGNFYGVAAGSDAIFLSCNGDDTKGWVARAKVENGVPGKLEPFIATKEAVGVDAPVPLTFDPEGKLLVVGQMGEITVPGDSLLTTYDPATGKLVKRFETGLNDITGLAYHPTTGKLYATDFSWIDTSNGGLFRLDIEGDKVTAHRLLNLDKPTALAFDSKGRLYVTIFGTAEMKEGAPVKDAGAVLLIEGEL